MKKNEIIGLESDRATELYGGLSLSSSLGKWARERIDTEEDGEYDLIILFHKEKE